MSHVDKATQPLWVVSELYYPEETSTGYFLTKIAEGLARSRPVRVLCGQPTYSARGVRAPWREARHGVDVERCWGTAWNKDIIVLRAVNLLTISLSILFRLLRRLRRNDLVLVVTNPPLLPFLTSWACKLRGAQCLLLIHDVYPDVALAAGLCGPGSVAVRITNWWVRRLYRSASRIIVLGEDMRQLVQRKLPPAHRRKTMVISNWADVDLVRPTPRAENRLLRELELTDKFVVQYAGNMGRSHDLEGLLKCVEQLRDETDIHFLIVGSGAKKPWLDQSVKEKGLTNITILNRHPRNQLSELLNACDVSIITFVAGMAGVSVPSRMYNVLAAGKPIIAVADRESELARVVEEESVGWVAATKNIDGLWRVILEARSQEKTRQEMGRRARQAAERKYPLERIIAAYERMFESHCDDQAIAGAAPRRAA